MADEVDIANDYTERGLDNAINKIKNANYQGESKTECVECGEPIPEARRKLLPGVECCVYCQELNERR